MLARKDDCGKEHPIDNLMASESVVTPFLGTEFAAGLKEVMSSNLFR